MAEGLALTWRTPSELVACWPDVPSTSQALRCPGLEYDPYGPPTCQTSSELWFLG